MRRFLSLAIISVFTLSSYAQTFDEVYSEYREALDEMSELSKHNSVFVNEDSVAKYAATAKNKQEAIDFSLMRFQHNEIIIQLNTCYILTAALEDIKTFTGVLPNEAKHKFSAHKKLAEGYLEELIKGYKNSRLTFELNYGYPELIDVSNILNEDRRFFSEELGLQVE